MNTKTILSSIFVFFCLFTLLGTPNQAEAKQKPMKVIETNDGKFFTGHILSETQKGYLFRTVQKRTVLIEFTNIKELHSVGGKSQRKSGSDRDNRDQRRDRDQRGDRDDRDQRSDRDDRDQRSDRSIRRPRRPRSDFLRGRRTPKQIKLKPFWPIIFNIFLPATIGSWMVGDFVGAGIGTGLQLVGGIFTGISVGVNWLSGLAPWGAFLTTAGWLVGVVSLPISVAIHNNRAKRANLLEKMKRKSLSDQGRSYGTLALPSVVTPTTTIHF